MTVLAEGRNTHRSSCLQHRRYAHRRSHVRNMASCCKYVSETCCNLINHLSRHVSCSFRKLQFNDWRTSRMSKLLISWRTLCLTSSVIVSRTSLFRWGLFLHKSTQQLQQRQPSHASRLCPPSSLCAEKRTNHGPFASHPTDPMADTHTYKFNVTMSCGGCSGAIDRVLKKLDGGFHQHPPPPPPLFDSTHTHTHTHAPAPASLRIRTDTCHLAPLPASRHPELRSLPREPDRHSRRRALAAVRDGAEDDRQDGQEGQLGRGGRRGQEHRRARRCVTFSPLSSSSFLGPWRETSEN